VTRSLHPRSLAVALPLIGLVGAFCAAALPARGQALSGFDLYRGNCGGCHELYDPENPHRTRDEWQTILTRMVKSRGATLDKQEMAAVLTYLDSFNRAPREIRWVETPAASRRRRP
jgi:hypothetical protein